MPQCLEEIAPSLSVEIVQAYMRIKGIVAMVEENNGYSESTTQAGLRQLDNMVIPTLESGRELTKEDAEKSQKFLEDFHYSSPLAGKNASRVVPLFQTVILQQPFFNYISRHC